MALHQVFRIGAEEVRIFSEELVLGSSTVAFSRNTVYLGVAKEFGEFRGQPTVRLAPFYKIIPPNDGDISCAKIEEPSSKILNPRFFRKLYTGPAEAISTALREEPLFSKMVQLADVVEHLSRPYDLALGNLRYSGFNGLVRTA